MQKTNRTLKSLGNRLRNPVFIDTVLDIVGIVVVIVATYWLFEWIGIETIGEWIGGAGVFAPIAFVFVKFLTVLIAPISSVTLLVLADLLFGIAWGSIYIILGITIGCQLAFWLSRRFGRPLLNKLQGKKALKKIDQMVEKYENATTLAIFLLIGSSLFDFASYALGLTNISQKRFFIIQLFATSITVPLNLLVIERLQNRPDLIIVFYIGLLFVTPFLLFITNRLFPDSKNTSQTKLPL